MSSLRDTQRQKLYNAEHAVHKQLATNLTWPELEALKNKIVTSTWFVKKYRTRDSGRVAALNIRLEKTHGGGRAERMFDGWEIRLGTWARCDLVLIHEITHCVVTTGPAHGWKFAEVFLDLVRHFMGKDAHDVLKASFKKHRVKFTAPRAKRELTPEQRAVLVERMAKARAAKQANDVLSATIERIEATPVGVSFVTETEIERSVFIDEHWAQLVS